MSLQPGRPTAGAATVAGNPGALSVSWRARRVVFGYLPNRADIARLFTIRPDGSAMHALAGGGSDPTVGPDGEIAVARGCCIWTLDPTTGVERRVTPPTLGYVQLSPSWSPDGSRIAFSNESGLFVVARDGTGLDPIVNGQPQEARWSPRGDQIAYTTVLGGLNVVREPDDGNGVRVLVTTTGPHISWSPDGNELAYVSAGIDVIDINDAKPRQLVSIKSGAGRVAWAPSGRRLAYTTDGTMAAIGADGSARSIPTWRLWTVNVDGSASRVIARGIGDLQGLDWGHS
jgi:Tol biopolymer transport system component